MSVVNEDADFDFAALLTLCGHWGSERVPLRSAVDGVFERLRQVLRAMEATPQRNVTQNLIPLLRQVVLRKIGVDGPQLWIRVPVAREWPTVQQWQDAQFDLLDDGQWLRVCPRPPRLSFLGPQDDLLDDVFFQIPSRQSHQVPGDPALSRTLRLPTYTGVGQREAVRALLHLPAGDILIANLPTGSGKSVLAQIPPLLGGDARLTVVIVPTIALAMDQARRMEPLLKERYPHEQCPPLAFHSGLSIDERRQVRQAIRAGQQRILFTSPESATGTLRYSLEESASAGLLDHLVVDEAHLVVGWGNGFRPAFQLLPALVATLRARAGTRSFRVVLASATLTASTTQALRHLFGPPERTYVVAAVHLRPEPRYAFRHFSDPNKRIRHVLQAVSAVPRPYILYVTRPDEAAEWLNRLRAVGVGRVEAFTGKTRSEERTRLLTLWANNELDGMVATSAFGLGVDKSDVRAVLHATMPESIDRFYQEVGRAGRDGYASASLLLCTDHPDGDIDQARGMAGDTLIGDDTGLERWQLLIDRAIADRKDPAVYWVDLRILPSHLSQRSNASQAWNVRTLTLMARAGLIELVALTNSVGLTEQDGIVETTDQATHAAVRILNEGHREPATFARRMGMARDVVRSASKEGLNAILDVAMDRREISEALQATYASNQPGVWMPVTACCGGCPRHWAQRQSSMHYSAPIAPRLQRFVHHGSIARWLSRCALAAPNFLVVDVPDDEKYVTRVVAIISTLLSTIPIHTIAIERQCEASTRSQVLVAIDQANAYKVFVDSIDAGGSIQSHAGECEVRVLVWGRGDRAPLGQELWVSRAALEILIIPVNLVDPDHPGRRFVDTTPHMHAADLLDLLTT